MIQRYIALFVAVFLIPSTTFAYRDVPQNSSSYPAVQYLIENDLYEDGSFFRPNEPVPARMFWEIAINASGFDPESAKFDTPLPSNIADTDPIAQHLREAIRRGFIDPNKPFDGDASVSRINAIRDLLEIKAINPPRRVSTQFLEKVDGVAPSFRSLPDVEAAYASGLITEKDIAPLRPHFPLTRKELAQWLYDYAQSGTQKSSIDPNYGNASNRYEFQYQKRNQTPARGIRFGQRKDDPEEIEISLGDGKTYKIVRTVIPDEEVFQSVYKQILQKYRFEDELTDEKKQELINAAIAGMVKALDDKYSSYVEPSRSQEFEEHLGGQFEGIGAYVEMFDDDFTITSPIKGSPAEKAGILPGDIVKKVDDEPIDDLGVQEIIKKIKGPSGTPVTLTIDRGNKKYVDITVIRGKITVPSVTLEWEQSIPVLSINQFGRKTAVDLGRIIEGEILPKNPRGLVIDLRNNPGGFLTAAVDVGEYFLEKDDLIFTVDRGDSIQKYESSRSGQLRNIDNIVILINKGSASASEILAGVMQDYNKATIMGSKSHGKGTVQELVNYTNGGVLRITVAKWLTPNGRWVQEGDDEENFGIHPDIVLEDQTPEQRREGIDPPLAQAINTVLGR